MAVIKFINSRALFLTLTIFSLTNHLLAQGNEREPSIFIVGPTNGTGIYYDVVNNNISSFYNIADETVTVVGSFINVKQEFIDSGHFAIYLNGIEEPATITYTGSVTVDGIEYRRGLFTKNVPATFDEVWPVRKFVAEVVNTKTYAALARHQIILYDLRGHSDVITRESVNTQINGMYSQITDRGIGHKNNDEEFNLEKSFKSVLPYPGLEQFNDLLSSNARAISRYDNNGNLLGACIKYDDITESNFKSTSKFEPYKKALREANNQFRAYRIAKRACNGAGAPPAVLACKLGVELTFCIKSRPKEDDFEICVDQIEGEVQSLEVGDVSNVGLNFEEANSGNRGLLNSHVTMTDIVGKVNGYLRSLSVRWRHPLCVVRPKEDVDDIDITRKSWLNKWTTCKNIVVKDNSVSTRTDDSPGRYQIKRDNSNSERPEVTLVSQGSFTFSGANVKADKDICKESFINAPAEVMAGTFSNPMRTTLLNTWYSGSPNTLEAITLTKLLSPYKLGENVHSNYDIFASYDLLGSAPLTGLQLYWLNSLSSTHLETLSNQKSFWFYAPQRGLAFSSDGKDHKGENFDISYSINTGFLNQILNMRSATPQGLHQIYKPTWEELSNQGVRIPAGKSPEQKATLNNVTLRQFDRSFIGIGRKTLEIRVKPLLDPIVYMPPDPTAATRINGVGSPTTYGIETLEVTFKEKDKEVNGENVEGKTWLKLIGGFVDKDFKLSIRSKAGAKTLKPHLRTDQWAFNVVETNLPLCPIAFSGSGGKGPVFCENRIERKVKSLISNAFQETFIKMLSDIPAPIYFDAEGEAKKKLTLNEISRRQEGQSITFYGILK